MATQGTSIPLWDAENFRISGFAIHVLNSDGCKYWKCTQNSLWICRRKSKNSWSWLNLLPAAQNWATCACCNWDLGLMMKMGSKVQVQRCRRQMFASKKTMPSTSIKHKKMNMPCRGYSILCHFPMAEQGAKLNINWPHTARRTTEFVQQMMQSKLSQNHCLNHLMTHRPYP